jgi:hypothetical protein
MPDGTMLSLPIPTDAPEGRYAELFHDGRSYERITLDLGGQPAMAAGNCHPDPDLRLAGRAISGWRPALGQTGPSLGHLENQGVGVGDLFLFFGWFRRAEFHGERLRFVQGAPDVHAVFGYLEVGEVLEGAEIARVPWHPHASPVPRDRNTVYTAAARLAGAELPGVGTLDYREDRVLTAPGLTRSRWKLLPWMGLAEISAHKPKALHSDYFQSTPRSQEFVIEDQAAVRDWALSLIK